MGDRIDRATLLQFISEALGENAYCDDALYEYVLQGAKNLPASDVAEQNNSEWISIESKLPPEGEECLIYDGDAIYVWELRRDRQTNELFFEDKYGYDQDIEDVEYWMPLPELPKEKNLHYISGMSPT